MLTGWQIVSFACEKELLVQEHGYMDKNDDEVACESLRCPFQIRGTLQQAAHRSPLDAHPAIDDEDLAELMITFLSLSPARSVILPERTSNSRRLIFFCQVSVCTDIRR
jgi:hypothetical protein